MSADLRRLAEQATPGPWRVAGESQTGWKIDDGDHGDVTATYCHGCGGIYTEADAAYIAAANPQAILALLDRLDDLETDFRREFSEVRGIVADRDALAVRVAALEEQIPQPHIDGGLLEQAIRNCRRRSMEQTGHPLMADGWTIAAEYARLRDEGQSKEPGSTDE